MEYQISYSSTNIYHYDTNEIYLDFLILPHNSDIAQRLTEHIEVSPSSRYSMIFNKNGFEVIRFMGLQGLIEFKLEMNCRVRIDPERIAQMNTWVEKPNAWDILKSPSFIMKNYFLMRPTGLTGLPAENMEQFNPREPETVKDYLMRLAGDIHRSITYLPGSTNTLTTASEAFESRSGVCQDIAHIFLGICRQQGIPARYVSGYLFVRDAEEAQLHAWTEVLIPGIGWLGIDPTNDLLTNENYVKIAHGIDYSECPSIKGIVRGKTDHSTTYKVAMQQ